MRLEHDAGLGIDEVEDDGGSPVGDPLERPFERGVPRRREQTAGVLFEGESSFGSVVFSVVSHGSVHDVLGETSFVVVGWRPWSLGELVNQLPHGLHPTHVELVEAHIF